MQTRISRDEAVRFLAGFPALTYQERLVSFCHLTTGATSMSVGKTLNLTHNAVDKTLQRARFKMRVQVELNVIIRRQNRNDGLGDILCEPDSFDYAEARQIVKAMDVKGSLVDLGGGLSGRPLTEYDVALVVKEGGERRRVLRGPLVGRRLGEEKCLIQVDTGTCKKAELRQRDSV